MIKVQGKVSRDPRLCFWQTLQASPPLWLLSSCTPSASNTLAPIKAKIVWITSHLCCPSYFFYASANKPHNKDGESYTSHTQCGSPRPLSPPPVQGLLQREGRPPSQALRFVPSCRNPIKVINCFVAKCWSSSIVPCDRYKLSSACGKGEFVWCSVFSLREVVWCINPEIKCHFAKLQDMTPRKGE